LLAVGWRPGHPCAHDAQAGRETSWGHCPRTEPGRSAGEVRPGGRAPAGGPPNSGGNPGHEDWLSFASPPPQLWQKVNKPQKRTILWVDPFSFVAVVSSLVKDEPGVTGHIGVVTPEYHGKYTPYGDDSDVWLLPPTLK